VKQNLFETDTPFFFFFFSCRHVGWSFVLMSATFIVQFGGDYGIMRAGVKDIKEQKIGSEMGSEL
jgi:hypothetical protein